MKKTKLLISLTILTLLLGSCYVQDDEPTLLSNYTLNISLIDEDEKSVVIPSYDSLYLKGSWDSYNDSILLNDIGDATGSILTTTFSSINEGKYTFNCYIGFTDVQFEQNYTQIISDGEFEVKAENGDNFTNELVFSIDTDLIPIYNETTDDDDDNNDDDEAIAKAILSATKSSYESSPWEAFYGECYDQSLDSQTSAFLSTDSSGYLYGSLKENDSESGTNLFQYYYFDNVEHFYNASNGYYSFDVISDSYEDLFNKYAIGLFTLATLGFDELGDDWEINHTSGSSYYTLVVKKENTYSATCRVSSSSYTFTKIEMSSGDESLNTYKSYSAEPTSASRVEQEVAKYNFSDWVYGEGVDPLEDIFNAVLEEDNYTLLIEYFEIYSDEYESATERNNDYQNTLVYTDYYVKITFTNDAVLMEYYLSYEDYVSGEVFDIELYVNDYEENSVYLYYLYEDNQLYLAIDFGEYGYTSWQGIIMSLYDFVFSGSTNYIVKGDTTIGEYGPQTNYIFDINFGTGYNFYLNMIDSLFDCGNFFVYMGFVYGPSMFEYMAYSYPNAIGYSSIYYASLGQWVTTLDSGLSFASNGSSYWVEEDIARATVYNIGTSSISNDFVIVDYPY